MEVDTSPWADAILPEGYSINIAGVFFENAFVSAPIWISQILVDTETNESILEISYTVSNAAEKFSATIDRADLYAQKWLQVLGGLHKFPIEPGSKYTPLKQYLYAQEQAFAKIQYFANATGWLEHRGKTTFVPFGPVQLKKSDGGIEDRAAQIKKAGDYQKWADVVLDVLVCNRRPCILFAAALAAPLLRIIKAPNIVIDVFNTSSSGKTIACTMAMSIWGNGEGLAQNWDTTFVGLEQTAGAFNDTPLFFDESQLVKDLNLLDRAVYNIANGKGRVRGKSGGGLRKTLSWKTCLLSTGEVSLLELIPKSYAGLDARTIPVSGKILDNMTGFEVERLREEMSKNHGHLGPRFIDFLTSYNHDDIRNRYHSALNELRRCVLSDDSVQRRKAEAYAVLLVAVDLLAIMEPELEEHFLVINRYLFEHWEEITKQHGEDQTALEALYVIMDYYAINEDNFTVLGDWDKKKGKVKDDEIYFLLSTWNDALTKGPKKFDPSNIVREFVERDWLTLDKDGKNNPRVSWGHANNKARVHILNKKAKNDLEKKFKNRVYDMDDAQFERENVNATPGGPTEEQRSKLKKLKKLSTR